VAFVALQNLTQCREYHQNQVHQPKREQAEQRCQEQQALALALQVYFETTTRHPRLGPGQ
jgi:hypothetical protein